MAFAADRKERLVSLGGVMLLHALLGWALLLSLAPTLVESVSDRLATFDVSQPAPPPPEPEPEPKRLRAPERAPAPREPAGKAAAPASRAEPPPFVAPPSKLKRDVPPPVAAGLVPSTGGETSRITSDAPGDGAGSGGEGLGSGSGSSGNGAGGGGVGGTGTGGTARAKLRGGTIRRSDYPPAAGGDQGIVEARLAVSEAGAVTGCTVTKSSGNPVLDATTCRLIRERFRFTPALDAQGNPIPDVQGWQQRWWRD